MDATVTQTDLDFLVRLVGEAVDAGPPALAPQRVEAELKALCLFGQLALPEAIRRPLPHRYARRLIHLDPRGRHAILAMVWGPGQRTPLHDHGGLWCVECVSEGEMESEAFRLAAIGEDGRFRFDGLGSERGGPGASGVIQAPLEYHVMHNPSASTPAVTLHVYGGELVRCRAFLPDGDDWYRAEERTLSYSE